MPPRYRPADYVTVADQFGRSPHVRWRIPKDGTKELLAAAKFQHDVALHVTSIRPRRPRSVA